VLVGTYELLALLESGWSAQLDSRTTIVELPRYKYENSDHHAEYRKILRTLQKLCPLPSDFSFEEYWQFFYEGSGGIIGWLKTWIGDTHELAYRSKKKKLSYLMFVETAIPAPRLKQRLIQIKKEEEAYAKLMNDTKEDIDSVRMLLGMPLIEEPPRQENVPSPTTDKKPQKPKGNRKPGVRNPKRDSVGRPFKNLNDKGG
jgi:hypothetical protein